jgi:hypothetical protein
MYQVMELELQISPVHGTKTSRALGDSVVSSQELVRASRAIIIIKNTKQLPTHQFNRFVTNHPV